jgi:8-oxo-dGTP diphosphatase
VVAAQESIGDHESDFLERYAGADRTSYARSEHTVDIALFAVRSGELCILLIRRSGHPEKGKWALPGGFVRLGDGDYGQGEDLEEAAQRELLEETGLHVFAGHLEQLKTYGSPWRDRRGRVFSTAYVALMADLPEPTGGGDAENAHFFAIEDLDDAEVSGLAFDHRQIVEDALGRVRGKIEYDVQLAASFLSEPFTIPELRRVYEAVWGGAIHRGDFRRKMISSDGLLVATGEVSIGTGGPPADLFRLGANSRLHPALVRETILLKKEV